MSLPPNLIPMILGLSAAGVILGILYVVFEDRAGGLRLPDYEEEGRRLRGDRDRERI